MNSLSSDQDMERTDTFCLMSPDGYHVESYEAASVWGEHSYHQRRADLLDYLAAELSYENSQMSLIDEIARLHYAQNVLMEPAHKRHQLLHERNVREAKPPTECDDECALAYIDGQPIPTEADLTRHSWEGLSRVDHEKVFQEGVLELGHYRLREVVRRLEEEEKIWDDYLKELRDWHEMRENKVNPVADSDDLPF
jgi:hypothetical protein